MKSAQTHTPHRDHSLDFLRGMAVILMIVTHVNGFFYEESGTVLDFFTWLGATVCFSTFLFVNGSVSGMTIKKGTMSWKRALNRSLQLLGLYYFIALVMAFFNESILLTAGNLFQILTFRIVPEFTEFIIPLVIFPLIAAFFLPILSKNKQNGLLLFSISISAFIVSQLLHSFDWGGGYLVTLKSLIVGEGNLHRFPILSYMPIFTLGLWWGMRNRLDKVHEKSLQKQLLFLSINVMLLLIITGTSTWERWPPSILFLVYGFVFIFGITIIHDYIMKLPLIHQTVVFFGHFSMSFYVYHLLAILFLTFYVTQGPLTDGKTLLMIVLTFLLSSSMLILTDIKNFLKTNISLMLR